MSDSCFVSVGIVLFIVVRDGIEDGVSNDRL